MEEDRIKAFSEMTLLTTPPTHTLLRSLSLSHFPHLQTPAWPQGGRGEADTDVIHSPPV